uniref:glutathione S-transferase T3-like n=1 Tax=Erigeron canadensis TaxID=72917 RepID=UPI001CB8CA9C|nr:glutathione S-transferase T3-like [Erigeron canadensis]
MSGFTPFYAPRQEGLYSFGGITPPQNTPDQQQVIDNPSPRLSSSRPPSPTPVSPDVEIVQETQPESQLESQPENQAGGSKPKKRSHKKKSPGEVRLRAPSIPWSREEGMALCAAWLSVTEDPEEANYQKEKTYWIRITDGLRTLLKKPKDYRDPEGIGAKWRGIRPFIQNFNAIYTRLTNSNNHQSGANDTDVIKRALAEFHGTYKTHFKYLDICEKIRWSSKFHYVTNTNVKTTRGEPTTKRSKTSSSNEPQSQGSDARFEFDLNNMTEDESAFLERPCGRDAAKKAAHGGSSSSSGKGKAVARYSETFDNLSKKLDGLFEASRERINWASKRWRLDEKDLNKRMLNSS